MPQAIAILIRKKQALTKDLKNGLGDPLQIKKEIKALDQAIEFINASQPSKASGSRTSH